MERLWSALEAMPDRRTRKGRRYSLASLVTLSLAAMLLGANDLLAVHRFGRRLTPKSLEMLGIRHGKSPAHATLHYVFASIDAEELARALLDVNAEGDPVAARCVLNRPGFTGGSHYTTPIIPAVSSAF